jgi:hypothetical protein
MHGQWWWAAVMLVGGLLAGGYVLRVLGKALGADSAGTLTACAPVSRARELVALAVALCAVLLGLVPLEPAELLQIGRPVALQVGAG